MALCVVAERIGHGADGIATPWEKWLSHAKFTIKRISHTPCWMTVSRVSAGARWEAASHGHGGRAGRPGDSFPSFRCPLCPSPSPVLCMDPTARLPSFPFNSFPLANTAGRWHVFAQQCLKKARRDELFMCDLVTWLDRERWLQRGCGGEAAAFFFFLRTNS
jgi:hypothetical protein